MPKRARDLLVLTFFAALTVVATWPLMDLRTPVLPDADDSLFSVWRIAWVAHQLETNPAQLFDGNIFFPARRTLAYSDAMLGLGAAGAPLIWSGLHPVTVHNLLLALAFVSAAFCCYVLCRTLTGQTGPAIVAGIIFAFSTFRFAHLGHLELLWTAFMPLSIWLLMQAMTGPRPRLAAAGAGLAIAAQALCSLYYFVFLAIYIGLWSLISLAFAARGDRGRLIRGLSTAALVSAIVLAPYLFVYADARRELGPRSIEEVTAFSAVPSDYLRVSADSKSYPPGPLDRHDERSLFPGAVAIVLAGLGLLWKPGRVTITYGVLLALAFDLSLGLNGVSYRVASAGIPVLSSLRAPARFGSLVMLSLAVLAACGLSRLSSFRRLASIVVLASGGLCVAEYWSAPVTIRAMPLKAPAVAAFLASARQPIVLELPVPPSLGELWYYETSYQFMSIYHWSRLVNGYSGYPPVAYLETLERLRGFPTPQGMARIRALGVEYVVVHQRYYKAGEFDDLMARLIETPGLSSPMSLPDDYDAAVVFRVIAERP